MKKHQTFLPAGGGCGAAEPPRPPSRNVRRPSLSAAGENFFQIKKLPLKKHQTLNFDKVDPLQYYIWPPPKIWFYIRIFYWNLMIFYLFNEFSMNFQWIFNEFSMNFNGIIPMDFNKNFAMNSHCCYHLLMNEWFFIKIYEFLMIFCCQKNVY